MDRFPKLTFDCKEKQKEKADVRSFFLNSVFSLDLIRINLIRFIPLNL